MTAAALILHIFCNLVIGIAFSLVQKITCPSKWLETLHKSFLYSGFALFAALCGVILLIWMSFSLVL
jgi:hypothetical protein